MDDTPGDQLADSAQKYQSEELTAFLARIIIMHSMQCLP